VGTNITNGTIVNPVKSGRINTKAGARIKYGRIEVVAKMPAGDWLWPAIWLLPVNNTYGDWPKSGEIDIAETRGNNHTYSQGGNNIINSAIHWGPNKDNDGWWRNNVKRAALHTTFSADFHTFGMEWSEKYLFTYVDNRLLQVSYIAFDQPLWERGQFPLSDDNGTRLINPWSATGRFSTPFDQEFYLILNVAVGGTNGWFQDGHSGKPWVDASPSARVDFWNSRHDWHRTWGNDARMLVKSVKVCHDLTRNSFVLCAFSLILVVDLAAKGIQWLLNALLVMFGRKNYAMCIRHGGHVASMSRYFLQGTHTGHSLGGSSSHIELHRWLEQASSISWVDNIKIAAMI